MSKLIIHKNIKGDHAMTYYFIQDNGMRIFEEDQCKGYYHKSVNPHMYLTKKGAVKAAIKELLSHIRDCQDKLRDYEKEEAPDGDYYLVEEVDAEIASLNAKYREALEEAIKELEASGYCFDHPSLVRKREVLGQKED